MVAPLQGRWVATSPFHGTATIISVSVTLSYAAISYYLLSIIVTHAILYIRVPCTLPIDVDETSWICWWYCHNVWILVTWLVFVGTMHGEWMCVAEEWRWGTPLAPVFMYCLYGVLIFIVTCTLGSSQLRAYWCCLYYDIFTGCTTTRYWGPETTYS